LVTAGATAGVGPGMAGRAAGLGVVSSKLSMGVVLLHMFVRNKRGWFPACINTETV
jgi:hypothetical protein